MEKPQCVSAILFAGMLLACLLVSTNCAAVHRRFQRAVAESSPSVNLSGVNTCQNSTPCAWAVYVPFTRRIEYFLTNTCECPQGKVCLRSDDDQSLSAYVYRCHVDTTNEGEGNTQVS